MRKILSDLEIDLAQYSVGLSFHEVPRYLVLVLVLVSRMTQAASHRDVLKLCCSPPAADFFAQFPHSNANNKKLGVSFRPIT